MFIFSINAVVNFTLRRMHRLDATRTAIDFACCVVCVSSRNHVLNGVAHWFHVFHLANRLDSMHGGYAALRQMTLITCFLFVYTTGPPEDHRRPQAIAEGTTGEHKRP